MTPSLKGQNCKFLKKAIVTQFPEETWAQRKSNQNIEKWPEGHGVVLECQYIVVDYSIMHKLVHRTQVPQRYGIRLILLQVVALDTLVNNPRGNELRETIKAINNDERNEEIGWEKLGSNKQKASVVYSF